MAVISRYSKIVDDTGPSSGTTQNSTSEVGFTSSKAALPANKLQAGDIVEYEGLAKVTNQNSTDTLTSRLRLVQSGSAVSGGVAVGADSAFDAATNDYVRHHGRFVVQTAGSSGEMHGVCRSKHTGGTEVETIVADQTIDTTVPLDFIPSAQWSVASASNVLTWKYFNVRIIPASEVS